MDFRSLFRAMHPAATPEDQVQFLAHQWLEKRKELKRARSETLETMCRLMEKDDMPVPGEVLMCEQRESDIERQLTKIEIQIDGALVL